MWHCCANFDGSGSISTAGPLGVSVHSTVGEGTTFTVVLPMAR